MRVPEAMVTVVVSTGSEIVVEYAGKRTVLEGRVREIVFVLMKHAPELHLDGRVYDLIALLLTRGAQLHLDDAGGVTFDWGREYINCTALHRVRVAAPAGGEQWLTSGSAPR